jgi:hypothetical protein
MHCHQCFQAEFEQLEFLHSLHQPSLPNVCKLALDREEFIP